MAEANVSDIIAVLAVFTSVYLFLLNFVSKFTAVKGCVPDGNDAYFEVSNNSTQLSSVAVTPSASPDT